MIFLLIKVSDFRLALTQPYKSYLIYYETRSTLPRTVVQRIMDNAHIILKM